MSVSHLIKISQSHPTRVRGLKFQSSALLAQFLLVAPYTGAWIEITFVGEVENFIEVAPYTGAWIEIADSIINRSNSSCRTLHGCVD